MLCCVTLCYVMLLINHLTTYRAGISNYFAGLVHSRKSKASVECLSVLSLLWLKLHWFDLLWIYCKTCFTTYPQQIVYDNWIFAGPGMTYFVSNGMQNLINQSINQSMSQSVESQTDLTSRHVKLKAVERVTASVTAEGTYERDVM